MRHSYIKPCILPSPPESFDFDVQPCIASSRCLYHKTVLTHSFRLVKYGSARTLMQTSFSRQIRRFLMLSCTVYYIWLTKPQKPPFWHWSWADDAGGRGHAGREWDASYAQINIAFALECISIGSWAGYATRRSCQVVWLTAYSIHMTGYLTLVLCVLVGIVEVGLSRRDDARARASV